MRTALRIIGIIATIWGCAISQHYFPQWQGPIDVTTIILVLWLLADPMRRIVLYMDARDRENFEALATDASAVVSNAISGPPPDWKFSQVRDDMVVSVIDDEKYSRRRGKPKPRPPRKI
jgi:hypothetical protein